MKLKLKSFIESIDLKLIDLFVIPLFIFSVFLIIESFRLVNAADHSALSIPSWAYSLMFGISIVGTIIFLVFEYRKADRNKWFFIIGLAVLLIMGAVSIFTSPEENHFIFEFNDYREITTIVKIEAKMLHYYAFTALVLLFYLGLFIYPNRIRNYMFIEFLCYIVYLFAIVALIFSFFKDDYGAFFGAIFEPNKDINKIKWFTPSSFFNNPNIYAFLLEFGIFSSMLHYSISKKKVFLIVGAIFYLHMFLTICKAAILVSSLLLLAVGIYKLVLLFRSNKSDRKLAVIIASAAGVVIISVLLVYFLTPIKDILNTLVGSKGSFSFRLTIWKSSIQIISSRPFGLGNGFGVYNTILFDATSLESLPNSVTHDVFLSILGRAGIVGIIAFLFAMSYTIINLFKNKNDRWVLISLLFGISLFFLHSLIEDNYHIMLIVCIIALMVAKINQQQVNSNQSLHQNN